MFMKLTLTTDTNGIGIRNRVNTVSALMRLGKWG